MRLLPLALLCVVSSVALAQEIRFTKGLGIAQRGNGRTILIRDAVLSEMIEGKIDFSKWQEVQADKDGVFGGAAFNSGYAFFAIESDRDQVKFLEATGHGMVYVNGVPHTGDPYSYGYVSLPVPLKKGRNEFMFATGRGRFTGKLVDAKPISLDLRDSTLPDIVTSEKEALYGAVIVRNATDKDLSELTMDASGTKSKLPTVPAMTIRKIAFKIQPNKDGKYEIKLLQKGKVVDQSKLELRIRTPHQTRKITFRSEIDGSLQYYAVNPSSTDGPNQALFLSVHGASVEAIGQADAYSPKSWGHLVAATNRRPYGFDWEEVGRLDALEVLEHARKKFSTDPSKTYLTGHSMGGHGTWQLGVLYPDKFAAIAPCAGWISFQSYGGGVTYPDTAMGRIFTAAQSSSDTLSLKSNFYNRPIFINHGGADETVPVSEARKMREELKDHPALQWNEEAGQGHWYDTDPEPGANCIDYAPIFEMFSRSRIPSKLEVRHVDFITPDPSISDQCHWLRIVEEIKPKTPARVIADSYPLLGKFVVKATNVLQLTLDISALEIRSNPSVTINGQDIRVLHPKNNIVALNFNEAKGLWQESDRINDRDPKAFKDIFQNNVLLVYGTTGTTGENAWSRNKAIFDAEQFWYRGNSSVDVISDVEFKRTYAVNSERNRILYGNAKQNSAWIKLAPSKSASLDLTQEMPFSNLDLPAGDRTATFGIISRKVAFIAPSGRKGAMLADRIPLFSSGVGIPAFVTLDISVLSRGIDGIPFAGFDNRLGNFVNQPSK